MAVGGRRPRHRGHGGTWSGVTFVQRALRCLNAGVIGLGLSAGAAGASQVASKSPSAGRTTWCGPTLLRWRQDPARSARVLVLGAWLVFHEKVWSIVPSNLVLGALIGMASGVMEVTLAEHLVL